MAKKQYIYKDPDVIDKYGIDKLIRTSKSIDKQIKEEYKKYINNQYQKLYDEEYLTNYANVNLFPKTTYYAQSKNLPAGSKPEDIKLHNELNEWNKGREKEAIDYVNVNKDKYGIPFKITDKKYNRLNNILYDRGFVGKVKAAANSVGLDPVEAMALIARESAGGGAYVETMSRRDLGDNLYWHKYSHQDPTSLTSSWNGSDNNPYSIGSIYDEAYSDPELRKEYKKEAIKPIMSNFGNILRYTIDENVSLTENTKTKYLDKLKSVNKNFMPFKGELYYYKQNKDNYNKDPRYKDMMNKDIEIIKSNPELNSYLKSKGIFKEYKYGGKLNTSDMKTNKKIKLPDIKGKKKLRPGGQVTSNSSKAGYIKGTESLDNSSPSSVNWGALLSAIGSTGLNALTEGSKIEQKSDLLSSDYFKNLNSWKGLESDLSSSIAGTNPFSSISDAAAGMGRELLAPENEWGYSDKSAFNQVLAGTIDPGPVFAYAGEELSEGDWGNALAGILLPGVGNYLMNEESKKEGKRLQQQQKDLNTMNMPRTVGKFNMTPNVMEFAMGGDMNNKLMQMQGPTHEEGGIQFTPDAELEGGETVYKDVVNSDQILITKEIANKYGLPNGAIKKTVAQYSKTIERKYKDREMDPFAMTSKEMELNNVAKMSMDLAKMYEQESNQMRYGGKIKYKNGSPRPLRKGEYLDENGRIYKVDFRGQRNYGPQAFVEIGQFMRSPINKKDNSTALKDIQREDTFDFNTWYGENDLSNPKPSDVFKDKSGVLWRYEINNAGQPHKVLVNGTGKDKYIPNKVTGGEGEEPYRTGTTQPEVTVTPKNTKGANAGTQQIEEPVNRFKPGYVPEDAYADYMFRKNLNEGLTKMSDIDLIKNNPQLAKSYTSSNKLPDVIQANYKGTGKNKTTSEDLLGLAPLAIGAFQAARTAMDRPDKVQFGRVHAENVNPAYLDPDAQLRSVGDTFATANEQMNQQSKKDWLRRRIQSATEEGKVKSGVLGQVQNANTQMLNQARQMNVANRLNTGLANINIGMQEENINAANKGAWETARDYQLSNLGTMAGEYGRDRRLESANKEMNEYSMDVIKNLYSGQTWDNDSRKWVNTGEGIGIQDTAHIGPVTDIHQWKPSASSSYIGEEQEYGPGINPYSRQVGRMMNGRYPRLNLNTPII